MKLLIKMLVLPTLLVFCLWLTVFIVGDKGFAMIFITFWPLCIYIPMLSRGTLRKEIGWDDEKVENKKKKKKS